MNVAEQFNGREAKTATLSPLPACVCFAHVISAAGRLSLALRKVIDYSEVI